MARVAVVGATAPLVVFTLLEDIADGIPDDLTTDRLLSRVIGRVNDVAVARGKLDLVDVCLVDVDGIEGCVAVVDIGRAAGALAAEMGTDTLVCGSRERVCGVWERGYWLTCSCSRKQMRSWQR